jgi:hypothetical protein
MQCDSEHGCGGKNDYTYVFFPFFIYPLYHPRKSSRILYILYGHLSFFHNITQSSEVEAEFICDGGP